MRKSSLHAFETSLTDSEISEKYLKTESSHLPKNTTAMTKTQFSLSLSLSLSYLFILYVTIYAAFLAISIPNLSPKKKVLDVRIYFVFSLGGSRLFNTQSRHQNGKSFSSSFPSKSVIFFLHGPP